MLSKKHIAFIDELFLSNFNATVAYKKVYKVKTDDVARANASRLLTNANINKEIELRQAKLSEKQQISRESLVKDLLYIKEQQKDIFPSSSIKAIEVIAKMLGLNEPDKIQHSGNIEFDLKFPTLEVDEPDDDEEDS